MNIGYYPGCALHGSSNDYEQSLKACLGALDVELQEVERLDLLRRDRRALAQSQAFPGAARAQPRPGRAGRLRATVRALPALLHAVAEGAKSVVDSKLREELSQIVEAGLRGDGQILNIIQLFQRSVSTS